MTTRLVKILSSSEHHELFNSENITTKWQGTPFDLSDGFIHLCFPHHVQMILSRYFTEQNEAYCLIFDSNLFGSELKVEDPRPPNAEMTQAEKDEGLLMPHLYGPLDITKALVYRVTKDKLSGEFGLSALSLE